MSDDDGHIVIVGCGRVGAGLAAQLVGRGHSVAVVDVQPSAFSRLRTLPVQQVTGVGFDGATLRSAGIEQAVGLAAVTNGDNTNIVVARTAREAFGVRQVVARIFDTRRAAIYERLGVPTVAASQLTIEMAMRHLRPTDPQLCWLDPSARVALRELVAPDEMIGRQVSDLDVTAPFRLVAVRRLGSAIIAAPHLVLQEGDVLYVATTHDGTPAVEVTSDAAARSQS